MKIKLELESESLRGSLKQGLLGPTASVSKSIRCPWGLRIGMANIPRWCYWPLTTLENHCSNHCPCCSWWRNEGAYDLNVASETGRSACWETWNAYCVNERCSSLPHASPQMSSFWLHSLGAAGATLQPWRNSLIATVRWRRPEQGATWGSWVHSDRGPLGTWAFSYVRNKYLPCVSHLELETSVDCSPKD